MSYISIIQIVFSAVAILISVVALVRGGRTQDSLVKVEEQLVAIEKKRETDRQHEATKARLRAFVFRDGVSNRHVLQVENSGLSEAREVRVVLDGQPVYEHPATAILPLGEEKTIIGPNSHIRYGVVLTSDTLPPSEIVVEWTDDSGETGRYRNCLSW